jgi:HEPN domain-containing protein
LHMHGSCLYYAAMDAEVMYWVELSDYDLETAEAMLEKARYLYVGFMCHQAIEKILKAFFVGAHRAAPPYTHNLAYRAKKADLIDVLSEVQRDTLDLLDPLHIEARYPSQKEQVLNSLTRERCGQILDMTRELHGWIRRKLSES